MKFSPGLWYYNKHSDTFIQCTSIMGSTFLRTWSRVDGTDLLRYSANNDEIEESAIPLPLKRGYRPFGKIKGRAKLIKEGTKVFLQLPRREQFENTVKEVLPKGFDEKTFRLLAYKYPDMLEEY